MTPVSKVSDQDKWPRRTTCNRSGFTVGVSTCCRQHVYFTAHESGQTIRDLLSRLGGGARKILAMWTQQFSSDGKRLAFVRRFSERSKTPLIANVDGTGERMLVTRKQPDLPMSGPSGRLTEVPPWAEQLGQRRTLHDSFALMRRAAPKSP